MANGTTGPTSSYGVDLIKNFTIGASYVFKGFKLINQPRVKRFAYLPIAINALLFALAIGLSYRYFDDWLAMLLPTWLPEWLMDLVMWIVTPVFTGLLFIVVFFSFSIFASFLAAPFNGPLSEAVEVHLSGKALDPTSLPWSQIVKSLPSTLWNELKKLSYFLKLIIPLLILPWIPVINVATPILWIIFSAWILCLEYGDYPMANHHMAFPKQRKLLRQHKGLSLGFGATVLGATMIPVINFLIIPVAVAGATALYVERLKP